MTARDRVRAALAHEETDICPYSLPLDKAIERHIIDYTGDARVLADLEDHYQQVGPRYPETNERIDATHYTDAYGVVWEESIQGEIGVVNDPILNVPSLEGYSFPPTRIPGLFDRLPLELTKYSKHYTYFSIGFSLFERAWSLRGMAAFLLDMIESPAFAHDLLDRICEVNLDLVDQACQHDFDCVRFGDDWGAQQGLIMGPDFWRAFIKPRMARMIDSCHSRGKTVFLHSDGDIETIIPDLIEMGLDILNPVQPDVMDIYAIKREYGKDLTLSGGVSVQQLLPHAPSDRVREEIRRLKREIGAGGGFILSPTHTLGSDIPTENLVAMIEEFLQPAEA